MIKKTGKFVNIRCRRWLIAILICTPLGVCAQGSVNELGIPQIRNFSSKETTGHSQNWAVTQDSRGVMYFANTDGVLEFDGVSWKLILTPTGLVFSIAVDKNDRIYVGSKDDLGYLSPDSLGSLQFVSLRDQLEEKHLNFSDIRRIYSTSEGVYFVAANYIFQWLGNRMKVWEAGENAFHISFFLNQTLYVRQVGIGLMWLIDDALQLAPGGDKFVDEKIYFALPYMNTVGSNQILMGSMFDGLFLYSGGSLMPFSTQADSFLKTNRIYQALKLPDQSYAICTLSGGLVVIDEKGEIKYILNRENGLRSSEIHSGFIDKQGALWLALQNGISRVDVSSPLTIFDQNSGIQGYILAITRYNGTLYAGTTSGLFALVQPTGASSAVLSQLIETDTRSFHQYKNSLLIGSSDGIYQLKTGRQLVNINNNLSTRSIEPLKEDLDALYVGTTDGLHLIRNVGGQWKYEGRFDGIDGSIRQILQEDQTLWLGSFHKGIYRVELDPDSQLRTKKIDRYDTLHGLPSMVENMVFPFNGKKVFITHEGIYRFDDQHQFFEPDSVLGDAFANRTRAVYQLNQSKNGNVWMHMRVRDEDVRDTGYASTENDGSYRWNNLSFSGHGDTKLYSLYPEDNSITWLGSVDLLLRYDKSSERTYEEYFSTLIRNVIFGEDSVIFGGAIPINARKSNLVYDHNAIRFQYAATSFDYMEENRYQYLLEGFDNDWSGWTPETQKDYTNLPEGDYRFRVRAKNVYDQIGTEDSFLLTILPPWYRTWWAYLSYLIIGIMFIQLIVRWRSKTLKAEKRALEIAVAERTKEIELKNDLLQGQAEKLKEMDKIKSNFFANISHEFRTPLTLIVGPLSDSKTTGASITQKHMDMMKSNADRLLRLVNQLLDLSKLETGELKLQAAKRNVVPFIKGLAMSFESLAINEEKTLEVICENNGIELFFDGEKLEKIIFNLLSNAFKFTDAKGNITLALINRSDKVVITVRDTGAGIEPDQLSRVFDRFYQVDGSQTRLQEGSGIGLALTKELVDLHHGTIEVISEAGEGTEFRVTLLKGEEHFAPGEVVEEIVDDHIPSSVVPADNISEDINKTEVSEDPDEDQLIVLIVEDNDDVRTYISDYLSPHYAILERKNGKEGLDAAREKIPDLVVSDVMMPEMDGFELTNHLKTDQKTSHIPVILLTAKAGGEDKIEGLETGADDYLTKPFDGKELVARINNLIKLRQQLRDRFSKEIMLEPAAIAAPSIEEKFIKQLIDSIEGHMSDPDLSVEKLSDMMAMSRIHLHRKLKALTDQSASQFIRTIRLKRAKQLLAQKSATVTEIAYQVGFNNISYFAKCFREQFGVLPSEFEVES